MTTRDDQIITTANRATALTALAAGGQKNTGGCLSSEEIAALVAGNIGEAERQHCLDHLSRCQSCYDEWRALAMEETPESNKIMKGPWFNKHSFSFTAAGSLLAAAACILLYLNLAPQPVMESQAPSPRVMERASSTEMNREHLYSQMPAEKAPAPLSIHKALQREEPALAVLQEAKKKEFVADMATVAPAKNEDAFEPRMQEVTRDEEEEIVTAGLAPLADGYEMLVDIDNVMSLLLKKMDQLGEGQALVLQTFKRDRSLTLIRLADERVLIREEGFFHEEYVVSVPNLEKTLKSLLEKEFPGSKQVRISFGGQTKQ